MPHQFKVDQTAMFSGVAFLSCAPKVKFGETAQETTRDGVPRWEVQVVAGFRDNFGKTNNEVMRVTVAAHKDPAEGLSHFTPVHLNGLEVGVMEKKSKTGEIVGVQVYYKAEAVASAISGTFRTKSGE
jgi:hypothetical protein